MSAAPIAYYLEGKPSFANVPITDEGVETASFLAACKAVPGIFDVMGNPAFAPVKNDIAGNVEKLESRTRAGESTYLANSGTIEKLIESEWNLPKSGSKNAPRPTTEGCLWLLRGLSFIHQALESVQKDPSLELSPAFNQSYKANLEPHHKAMGMFKGKAISLVFTVAMAACPTRAKFYENMGLPEDKKAEQTTQLQHLDEWLKGLGDCVAHLQKFYAAKGYDKGPF